MSIKKKIGITLAILTLIVFLVINIVTTGFWMTILDVVAAGSWLLFILKLLS